MDRSSGPSTGLSSQTTSSLSVSLSFAISWLLVTVGLAAYLAGRGFTHPLLGGLLWPLTACAFVLAARAPCGSRLRIAMGFDSGLTPVSPSGHAAIDDGAPIRYGQIDTVEDDR